MSELGHIAYRGYLRSCNYHCAYCPFSKQRLSAGELAKDQAALKRFVDKVRQLKGALTIQLLPYGEALIHEYYCRPWLNSVSWGRYAQWVARPT